MNNQVHLQGASWIGIPQSLYEKEGHPKRSDIETAYFRHIFILKETGNLEISISASSRYRLWVNNQPVTSGPCKGDRWHHYYETVDISTYLKQGENIIAVKVVAYPPYEARINGIGGPFWSVANAAGPCLIVKGACVNAAGEKLSEVTTGQAEWQVALDHASEWQPSYKTFWMGAMEKVYGEKLPHGWRDSSSAEGNWVPVEKKWSVEKDPYGIIPVFPLQKRPIPLLFERKQTFKREMPIKEGDLEAFTYFENAETDIESLEYCRKAEVAPYSKRVIELDAGELTTGYFQLPVEGGKGSQIRIRYAECYSKESDKGTVKGIRDDSMHYDLIGHEDIYYPSGRVETYEPFWFRTFRFVRIEVETGAEGMIIFAPSYIETGYPLEVKTEVSSSEEWIKSLWDISWRTLQRCMHETYEDCPYYEQMQYTMDTRLQMLFMYILSGDTRMALRTIEDYHSSLLPDGILQSRYPCEEPQVIPTFAFHWIFMLEDYYWQTGDVFVPRRYRPTVDTVLDYFDRKIGSYGLVEGLGYWEQADWVEEWDDIQGCPRAVLYGPSTIHNLIYAYALQTAARLSEVTGRKETAREYEERANKLLAAVEQYCWTAEEGLYREGPEYYEYSQHAQVWAVLTGLASGERAQSIMKKAITKEGVSKCSFPLQFYLFRALEKVGLYEETEGLWELWKKLIPMHLTTVPEVPFTPRSDCHAWGALPLYEFTRSLLGINPLSPGWGGILIAPKIASLPEAKGQMTTPKGMVAVEWKKEKNKFFITGKAPFGVPVEVKLPDGTTERFTQGGVFKAESSIGSI